MVSSLSAEAPGQKPWTQIICYVSFHDNCLFSCRILHYNAALMLLFRATYNLFQLLSVLKYDQFAAALLNRAANLNFDH